MRLKALSDFPVKIHLPLSWGDQDIFGHINNISFLKYFENAHAQYLETIGFWDYYHKHGKGGVISELKCNYLTQLNYPDEIEVGARIVNINDQEAFFEYYIFSEKAGLAAIGSSVFVFFDYSEQKKTEIPKSILDAIYNIDNPSKT